MGMSGIGPSELVVILLIALLLFGTKRLKTIGGDLGGAIKSFREAMNDGRLEAAGRPTSGKSGRAAAALREEAGSAPAGDTPVASSAPQDLPSGIG
jgi:sec-independent protein translocase protein TatA